MMLIVNIVDSNTTEAWLVTYLSFRKIRVKQNNNIKGFDRNQLLLSVYMLVSIIYKVESNTSLINLLMKA